MWYIVLHTTTQEALVTRLVKLNSVKQCVKSFTDKAFTHSTWSESRTRRQNVLPIAKSHFQTNRKWKYGGTLIFKLAALHFLFDHNTNYGSIRNRFQARNYFQFLRNWKYWHRTTAHVKNGFRAVHERLSDDYCQFWPKHHLPQNRKWKYGENSILQLATVDFLFDFNTMYGSIGHRFNARNYFRSRRNRKYKNLTTTDLNNASRTGLRCTGKYFRSPKPIPVKPEVEIWRKLKNELAAIDFLFDLNTMYGSIGHHFDARNYFRSHRNRKYWNVTSADLRNGSRRPICD